MISTLLSITKSTQMPLRMVSLLDVAVSVLIRLKNVSDGLSHRLSQDLKVGTFHGLLNHFPSSVCQDSILGLYLSTIITTKISLPEHTLVSSTSMIRYINIYNFFLKNCLRDFISTYITAYDFTATILPTIEKVLLRSPEHGLPGMQPRHTLSF